MDSSFGWSSKVHKSDHVLPQSDSVLKEMDWMIQTGLELVRGSALHDLVVEFT